MTKAQIITVLKKMYSDYQNNQTINRIVNYNLTPAYARKLIGSDIITRMTKSKRDMYYKWNGGVNPNFNELADRVLATSVRQKAKNIEPDLNTSKLVILLFKAGVDENKIPQMTREIRNLFI
jgi:hypothetical protein